MIDLYSKIEKLLSRDLGGSNFSWTEKISGSESSTLSFTRVDHQIVGGVNQVLELAKDLLLRMEK